MRINYPKRISTDSAVGKKFTYQGINYSTISSTEAQVGYGYRRQPFTSAVSRDYEGDIVIPSFVTDNLGTIYRVTKIGDHAFFSCNAKIISFNR